MSPETTPMPILALDQTITPAELAERQHNYHGFENRSVHPHSIHTVSEVVIGGEEEEEANAEEYANLQLLEPLVDDGEPQDDGEGEESEDEQAESEDDDAQSTDKEDAVEVEAPQGPSKRPRQVASKVEPNVEDEASAGTSKRRRTYSKSGAQVTQSSETFIIDVIIAEAETKDGGTQVYVSHQGLLIRKHL